MFLLPTSHIQPFMRPVIARRFPTPVLKGAHSCTVCGLAFEYVQTSASPYDPDMGKKVYIAL